MTFNIDYYERGQESQALWTGTTREAAKASFERAHPLADVLGVDRVREDWEGEMELMQAIILLRDEPVNKPEDQMSWHCDIWEAHSVRSWPLFATAWGHTRTEAVLKANLIIAACGRNPKEQEDSDG